MAGIFYRSEWRKALRITKKLLATSSKRFELIPLLDSARSSTLSRRVRSLLIMVRAMPNIVSEWPRQVTVVEVGPRDGLQNEPVKIPTVTKLEFINKLLDAGVRNLEVTSFVSAKWVPQLADHREVMLGLDKSDDVNYIALVPNLKGLEAAISCDVKAIAVFLAASETFSRKNINCSIDESVVKANEVIRQALNKGIKVRGYISCVCGCPYEGPINPQKVAALAKILHEWQCYEISLGDTIGVGTPGSVTSVLNEVMKVVPAEKLAVHFHDTYGQALANIVTALQMGVTVVDSAVGGLGGCPYAKGASGNVATEDLIYMLQGMGIHTGIDINKLVSIAHFMTQKLGKQPHSRVSKALATKLS